MSKCCPLYPRKMGYSACQLVDSWKIWGAALQADGETRSVYAASSIRRRSAAWTILLDSTCRSRRRASALWMMRARSCGKRGWQVSLKLSCRFLTNTLYRFKRVGLEAGPLSQWLYSSLAEAGLPVICVEARHMRAVLRAQINKTDRND